MHAMLAVLGTVVTILVLLVRLADAGIDLGWLNPYLWYRRWKWQQKVSGDLVYSLDSPMDVTALLMVAVAKCDGDMSVEQKRLILGLFEQEFHLSPREASALLNSSAFLLKDGDAVLANLGKVLAPSRERFTRDQAESAKKLIARVGSCEGKPSAIQAELIEATWAMLSKSLPQETKWT